MSQLSQDFLNYALEREVLRFGEFTLKSGRVSPYFFNAGLFHSGEALSRLGRFYAARIVESGIAFDMLFGPAYKGIPLVAATAMALFEQHGVDVPWAFNRKEAKAHGEGGSIVGAPLQGRVLMVDDVMTAGTAMRESIAILQAAGATPVAVAVLLDRQERGQGELSAVQELERDYALQALPLAGVNDLIELLRHAPQYADALQAVEQYRAAYGVA
ncbi:MAG: orotate phosphoribosyltransferase [Gammaproteobacteria bacterium 28-57-27]|nr:MAG: orotate phosphoribosyltransferase [Gammaproteobacteria bacterium 28-57-27]